MVAQETLDTIEETLDVVEETLDTLERIPKVNLNGTTKKQQYIILGVTAVVSAAAGGGVAYFFANRHLRLKYEAIAEKEVADAKKYYSALHKKAEFSDPVETATRVITDLEQYAETVDELGYGSDLGYSESQETKDELVTPSPVPEEAEVVRQSHLKNVFTEADNSDDEFDYETEMRNRSVDAPYIITHDEFYENEPDYQQVTLTYFEGDDVLMDEKDQPISDTDATVGDANLTRFGHGSKDKNIVHVRNDKLELVFEIIRSDGEYVQEVLGFIQHSNPTRPLRKFRSDDE